jgi:hypothetical protein
MTKTSALTVWMAASLLLAAGCKKDDESAVADASTDMPTGMVDAAAAPAPAPAVMMYTDMIPQSGVRPITQTYTVYQGADVGTPVLGKVVSGQTVNLKASRGTWMLVDWPSAMGQSSPGWIDMRSAAPAQTAVRTDGGVVDAAAPVVDAAAPVVDAATPVVDAAAPVVVDAGAPAPDAGVKHGGVLRPRR